MPDVFAREYLKRAAEERQRCKEAVNLSAAISHERLALAFEYMARIATRAEERRTQAVLNDAPQRIN